MHTTTAATAAAAAAVAATTTVHLLEASTPSTSPTPSATTTTLAPLCDAPPARHRAPPPPPPMATVASSTNLPPPGSPSASPKAHVGAVLRRWSTRLGLGSSPSLDSRPQPAAAVPADRAAQSTLSPPGPAASASPPPAKPPPHLRPLNEAQRSATYPDVAKCNGWSRVEYNIHVAPPRDIWVDCDPGHDDALALLVATHHPGLRLVGVSTVSGNTSGRAVYINAARILVAIGADQVLRKQSQHSAEATAEDAHDGTKHALDDSAVQPILLRGADAPLLQPVRRATSMHSDDGLKGVAGLPALDDPDLAKRLWASYDGTQSPEHLVHGAQTGDSQPAGPTLAVPPASPARVVSALAADLLRRRQAGGPPLHVCVTGPCTNLALLIKMHPELVAPDTVASIVIMAGTAESKQDESSGTEFNAAGDPEALAIVFNHPVRVVMMGLNVTHQGTLSRAAAVIANVHGVWSAKGGVLTLTSVPAPSHFYPGGSRPPPAAVTCPAPESNEGSQ